VTNFTAEKRLHAYVVIFGGSICQPITRLSPYFLLTQEALFTTCAIVDIRQEVIKGDTIPKAFWLRLTR
jgi:hypothetical protein